MKKKLSKKRPLRLVVDAYQNEYGAQVERLECGHVIARKQDIYGYTNAHRRRCRKCEAR